MVAALILAVAWGIFPVFAYFTGNVTPGGIVLALLGAVVEYMLFATVWSDDPHDLPHQTDEENRNRERAILHRHLGYLVMTVVFVAVQINHFNHFII